jgi:predicted RND superfamily exporter protein
LNDRSTLSDWIARFLVRKRWLLLALAVSLAAIAYPWSRELKFERSIENMFAADDPALAPFRRLKRTFGGDEIALAAYIDPHLLESAGLNRLSTITSRLARVQGVASVFSLSTSPILGKGILWSPLREKFLRLSEGYTIGADHQTAGIVCLLEPETERVPRTQTIDQLRRLIEEHDPTGVVTGEPVMIVDGFRHLEEDGRLLGSTSTVLLMLTIIVCFRSLRWVIVPIAVMLATLVWTQGTIVASGYQLSMVSSMLWALVAVICIATVVHLIVAFREERQLGGSPPEALRRAGAALLLPIFWSCLTDAAGFGSLLVARVSPVRDFGAMMALASILALVSIATILPGLALAGRSPADPQRAWGEGSLDVGLRFLSGWIEHHPRLLALLMVLGCSIAMLGITRLEVETDFTKNFRSDSPLVKSYEFVESRLGGAGVLDVVVPVPVEADKDFLPRLRRLQQRLRSEVTVRDSKGRETLGLTKALSVGDALDFLPGAGSASSAQLSAVLEPLKTLFPLVKSLHGFDPQSGNREYVRIMLRARERQPAPEKHRLIEQVERLSREEFPEAEVTGFFVLLTRLIGSISRDQWLTFGVATCGIALMTLAAFRSPTLALVALVPNAMPILVLTGMMGWLGLRINMGAAMIASVSMGMAVDSSIHYITDFRRHMGAGLTLDGALHAAHQKVGRAMIFSTFALVVGFSALCMSQFVPTIYFGVLVSLSMLGGLLGNLIVLPLLLKLVTRN